MGMRNYIKYEFCKSVDCVGIRYMENCAFRDDGCRKTAKEFHDWLKNNEFFILKAVKKIPFSKQMESARKIHRVTFRVLSEKIGIPFKRLVNIEKGRAIPDKRETKMIKDFLRMDIKN